MENIALSEKQKEIMTQFYSLGEKQVVFNKNERNVLWKKATRRSENFAFDLLKTKCPALEHKIRRSYESGMNIQSAVFSECVYAQTFADMLELTNFINCDEVSDFIPSSINSLLKSYHISPNYIYSTEDKRKMLIQAGGHDGVDSALITVVNSVIHIHLIEFKEPSAKASEPDLPKYGEDGFLVITENWLKDNPQFKEMIEEQKKLNFFKVMGSNINDFSKESVDIAVSNNYTGKKKFADVILTEDKNGILVMLPANQATLWADVEGEIRPAGRNHYRVWTPLALNKFLLEKGATIVGNKVSIKKTNLDERRERGGNHKLSGYKITPLFFIYIEYCNEDNGVLTFDVTKIKQLNPTITGKMFFKKLKYQEVKQYYGF